MRIRQIKWKVSITKLLYFFIVCIAVLRAMQFHVDQGANMDFRRHMYMMELVKNSDYSLFEYVFLHGDAFTSNITMRFSYTFNLIIYVASHYLDNYYIVAWLFVFFDYCIIAYIGIDWWKNQGKRSGGMIIYEILLCFSLLPFIHAVSGLRTAFAACIMALAVYLYLHNNKGLKVFLFLAFLSVTTHVFFICVVPFVILAKKVNRTIGFIISLVGSVLVSLLANLFVRSGNYFLYGIASKYLDYTGDSGYVGTRFCYYGVIVISVLILCNYIYTSRLRRLLVKDNGTNDNSRSSSGMRIYDFIAYYTIFLLSNIGSYEMVLRPAYLLGALAPVVTGLIFGVQNKSRIKNGITNVILIMLFIILIYVSYMYLIWHSEYFVLNI